MEGDAHQAYEQYEALCAASVICLKKKKGLMQYNGKITWLVRHKPLENVRENVFPSIATIALQLN